MERRNRIVLTIMAMMLLVLSGVSLSATVMKVELMKSNSLLAYASSNIVNTVTGVYDLETENSEDLTLKTVNSTTSNQVCSYNVIYTSDSFNGDFTINLNGEEVLVETSNVVLYEDMFTINSNTTINNTFTVSSNGSTGTVKISNIECYSIEK